MAAILCSLIAAACPADAETDAETLADLAATGAWLHGRAARLAAERLGPAGGPITALDVAEALPRAVAGLL